MNEFAFPGLGERCYFERLPNGLPVYVIPKSGFSKTFAFCAVRYGGMDQHFQIGGRWYHTPAGVAHYLEHKMFDLPDGNALQIMASRGASPNAYTASDITGYYFSCTERFEENLCTLLRMVTTPYFTEESIAKEQGIIGQEIRMLEDSPEWWVYQNLMQILYQNHPIRNSVAGTVASIAEITPEILKRCHSAFYRPDNMVLCVAGNVEPRRVMQLAAASLNVYEEQKDMSVRSDHGAPESMEVHDQEIAYAMEVSIPRFMLGFKAEPVGSLQYRLTGELAAELLIGESSPLYEKLYQKGLIDRTFGMEFGSEKETAHFIFGGESQDPAAVTEAILQEGIRIAWNGLDDATFRRVKKALYGSRVQALNSFEHTCIQMAKGHFSGYRYLDFATVYGQIERQDVEELLRESITGTRCALSVVNPKGA